MVAMAGGGGGGGGGAAIEPSEVVKPAIVGSVPTMLAPRMMSNWSPAR
jgi:hypothetical protein